MNAADAAQQLSDIHAQLAKGEIYRGYRPAPVALSGVIGVAAGFAQPLLVGDGFEFVWFWVGVAVLNLTINGLSILSGYLREDRYGQRHTETVVGQLLPSLAAGAVLTAAALLLKPALISALPAVWALLFGLGLFASRPYLPRFIGWVALYHFVLGGFVLQLSGATLAQLGWVMGLGFGLGQLAAAGVLWRNEERDAQG